MTPPQDLKTSGPQDLRTSGPQDLVIVTRDWRQMAGTAVDGLYRDEIARWGDDLFWDTAATWRTVEAGRRLGTVPGFAALDDRGRVRGWAFCMLEDDTLQIGGFLAATTTATTALLDALAGSVEGRAARRWVWFGYFDAPGLADAIAARGGAVARYRYMRCRLRPGKGRARQPGPLPSRARAWRAADARHLAALLSAAYCEDDAARPFAPTGRTEEWHDYVVQLLATGGCGIFDPRLSLTAGPEAGPLDAAALVTLLSPRTAHLAQLVVRRDAQTGGLGSDMLAGALALASARGCAELTLLVHEQNAAAVRLYERAGFADRAAFLSAVQMVDQPRTSSSDALATGGVSTRR